MIKALLWDVDGTMAETERDGHRVAFNEAFESVGLSWRWSAERYGELLRITGGRERLLHDMAERSDAPTLQRERELMADELHRRKNLAYARLVTEKCIPLRAGVLQLMDEAYRAGLKQAIVTTTSRVNVQALLGLHMGQGWRSLFQACICGEDVRAKKPDSEAYERALKVLDLNPLDTLALEDSPGGVASAQGAGVPVLVTRSAYFAHDTVEAVVAVGPGLGQRTGWRPALAEAPAAAESRVTLDDLVDWHARMELVSQFG
jgi:HAD superfamily hydrolase (TIGR01509 family)